VSSPRLLRSTAAPTRLTVAPFRLTAAPFRLTATPSRSTATRRYLEPCPDPPVTQAIQCRDAWSLVWGCPAADSGGEGAAGGAPHLSVVVAAMPQSLLGSLVGSSVCSLSAEVVMGNSEVWLRPAKVQPSLVPTVVVVDISGFLELGCGFLRVFLVELADEVG